MKTAVFVTLGLLLFPPCAGAAVIRVPGDVGRIETALFVASPYDTVLVSPGDYPVNLLWPATAGIKLLSEAGPDATRLDGGGTASVIGIYTGVDTTTVVAGFTILGGHADGQ